jgi:RND family efflux transporter MFP subunit
MPELPKRWPCLAGLLPVLWTVVALQPSIAASAPGASNPAAPASSARAALTVQATTPQKADWPLKLAAAGSVAAWQEVVIGSETSGLRLIEVLAQVGDRVKRGQLLARLSSETLAADLAQSQAALSEGEALLAEATANADRARMLSSSGAMSQQQSVQMLTAERTAQARLASLRAKVKADEVRLAQTRILAPDDGVISARWATPGAMAQPGQELFRLIRRERLEWRAEVPASDLARLKAGVAVTVTTPAGQSVKGTVRMVGPVVDAQTRNGLVYVDLAAGSGGLEPAADRGAATRWLQLCAQARQRWPGQPDQGGHRSQGRRPHRDHQRPDA